MAAIALALAGSIAAGATDFFGGWLSRRLGTLVVLVSSHAAGLVLIGVAAAIVGVPSMGVEFLALSAASGLAVAIGAGSAWRGLAIGHMGVIAPIVAVSAIIPVGAGVIQGESLSVLQSAGIALAIIGVAGAAYEPGADQTDGLPIARGMGFALVGVVGLGFFYVAVDAAAEQADALSASLINRATSTAFFAVLAVFYFRRLHLPRADVPKVIGIGTLEISAILLVTAATTIGFLAIVGTVGALFPITTILLARFFLNERLAASQRIGSILALAGVGLITAGVA
jgi:drug/metabolite transporter (DMT)-like permease